MTHMAIDRKDQAFEIIEKVNEVLQREVGFKFENVGGNDDTLEYELTDAGDEE